MSGAAFMISGVWVNPGMYRAGESLRVSGQSALFLFPVPGKPGTGLSSTFRPTVPITLLVFTEVLSEHGSGPVFLRHGKCSTTERMVFGKAACGRRALVKYRGGVLGYLDEFGCDDGVEPDKVGKHLFCFCILHTDEVITGSILMVRDKWEGVNLMNLSQFEEPAVLLVLGF